MSHSVKETKEMTDIEPRAGPGDAPSSDPKIDMMANAKDIGAAVYAEARNLDSDDLEGERQRVKRKMDRILMPMVSHALGLELLPTVL
jgi:5,10-methylenetetrahydrofolate reductase